MLITLKNGQREFENGMTPLEIAGQLSQELKKQDDVKETKTLKSTLDSWDATKVANAIAETGTIAPVVDNVEDINHYTASVGEVKVNG